MEKYMSDDEILRAKGRRKQELQGEYFGQAKMSTSLFVIK